jgi:hypothetical protein
MPLGPCILTLVLAGEPALARPPCETARLLKVRTVARAEARAGGPVPPTDEGAAPAPDVAPGTLYDLTLECAGKTYMARVVGGTPGFRPGDLEAASTLRLRAEGGKLFLKREGGTEFEATLAAAGSPRVPPPK